MAMSALATRDEKAQRFAGAAMPGQAFQERFWQRSERSGSTAFEDLHFNAAILEGLLADGVALLAGFELGPLHSIEL